ncbi:nucleotidyltransferase family protein [Nonomuraea turkmeniaca]|uniref:Nucleotidyltransferase family protein n=1 Tax=Nonomuraea turkmeniaca TaxID=103838 RepID=A0A5S4FJH0_9ACTN|nr:nucleotidyltransferase family protein [Nonomuraea turkmeniaca]TMR20739.1 nucleotidyltransferase family protein [Nonomuraea turkmeniaca]
MDIGTILRRVGATPTTEDRRIHVVEPPDRTVEALRRHRLTGQAAMMVKDGTIEAPQTLTAEILTAQQATESRWEASLEETALIQRHLHDHGINSYLVKGCAAQLLTDGVSPKRFGADIDLVVEGLTRRDVARLVGPLAELGYASRPDHPCGLHEAGHFGYTGKGGRHTWRDGGEEFTFALDIHHAFPVWGYPALDTVDLDVPGPIHIDPNGVCGPADKAMISWREMADNAHVIETQYGPITTLGPELTAVIGCANAFRDYVKPHWSTPLRVHLGHLAEIVTLVTMPGFDGGKFRALVDRWSAHDSVSFTTRVLIDHLGHAPDILRRLSTTRVIPHHTLWSRDHYPVLLKTPAVLGDVEDQIWRTTGMRDLAGELGATRLDATPFLLGDAESRSFSHRLQGRHLRASASIVWGQETLTLTMEIDDSAFWGDVCVLVNFGDPAFEFYRGAPYATQRVRNRGLSGPGVEDAVDLEWSRTGGGLLSMRATVPLAVLPSQPELSDGEIGLMLGLQDIVPDDLGRSASIVAPLLLVPPL